VGFTGAGIMPATAGIDSLVGFTGAGIKPATARIHSMVVFSASTTSVLQGFHRISMNNVQCMF